jgi:hypothetical protein
LGVDSGLPEAKFENCGRLAHEPGESVVYRGTNGVDIGVILVTITSHFKAFFRLRAISI